TDELPKELAGFPNLTALVMTSARVTDAGAEVIRRALSHCAFGHSYCERPERNVVRGAMLGRTRRTQGPRVPWPFGATDVPRDLRPGGRKVRAVLVGEGDHRKNKAEASNQLQEGLGPGEALALGTPNSRD